MKTLLTLLTVVLMLSFTQIASAHGKPGKKDFARRTYNAPVYVKAFFGYGGSPAFRGDWYDQRYYGKRPFFKRGPFWKKFYRKANYRPYRNYWKHRDHRHDRDHRRDQGNWYDKYWQ